MLRRPSLLPWLACLPLLMAACAPGNRTIPTPLNRIAGLPVFAVVNGTLIDGTGANPVADAAVIIQDGRILYAGTRNGVVLPADAEVLDAGGGVLLPGFINAHVHFAYDEAMLKKHAQGGVTTVRDEGILDKTPLRRLLALRDRSRTNPRLARLVSAGYMITAPNGYGQLDVESPEDARSNVSEELKNGVDQIKIALEDGYAGQHDLPKLTDGEIAAIVAEAHAHGVRVSGHITQAAFFARLTSAGVDDIAHTAWDRIPDNVLADAAAKGIYLVPTFTVFRNYGAPIPDCVDNVRRFLQAGGRVALGNDYGGGPGDFETGIPMYEIEQMTAAGMTPMQIILASTRHAAQVVGLEKEIGTLEAGKIADILVVAGDPLQDLKALQWIRMVIHYGVVIRDTPVTIDP